MSLNLKMQKKNNMHLFFLLLSAFLNILLRCFQPLQSSLGLEWEG